ncbi:MAG TPA: SpoIIE family protein phosphatase, partial [Candidatus Ozemobacteraceae bacterium]|nr:SpoIIE family protein phosphatase [Candidatus Ozemobacteraceae bacterium]
LFAALLVGILCYWWYCWRPIVEEIEQMQREKISSTESEDFFFQPIKLVGWLEENISRLKNYYSDLERVSQLISFINYSYELPRQLKVALNLAHEVFPRVTILVFLPQKNQVRFEVGTRINSSGILEPLAREDGIVARALDEVNHSIDLSKLHENNWRSFTLPVKLQAAPDYQIMPLTLWNRVLGLVVYDTSERHRPFDNDERVMAVLINRQMALFIENHLLYAEKVQQERLHREVEIARQVQTESLPSTVSPIPGYDIFGLCNPCHEISGDYYDLIPLGDGRALIALADVSGKGLPAALFLSKIQTLVRALAHQYKSPAQLLSFLSKHLSAEKMGALFATMVIVIIESGSTQAICSSAGHCKPLIVRPGIGLVEELNFEVGIPLGLFDMGEEGYSDILIDLIPGDGIFLYSDGVSDLTNAARERYGTERVRRDLDDAPRNRAAAAVYHLLERMNRFKGQSPLEDDVTMVFIKSEPRRP